MPLFPQYSNVYETVQSTIKNRRGNNLEVSKLKPWIRISSGWGKGLVLGSNLSGDTFDNRYGDGNNAGKIGNDFGGNPVFEDKSHPFHRGYRPSPTIESINIKNGAEGLSRKLTFQIKCFSLPQLDTITKYFLEPRFYLLAEWGWNTNNSHSQMAKVQGVDAGTAICDMISYINLGVLKDKRSNSNGQYDAFLGVITGGGVSYGEDETYLVDVEVTTQGEIPAYLQQHKGVVKNIDTTSGGGNDSSKIFDVEKDIEKAEKAKEFGRALFMYMYNDLPGAKQIDKIKKWVDDPKWNAEYNYINMNKTIKDELLEDLSEASSVQFEGEQAGEEAEIPSDQPLISEQRFIRMELAWEILNTTDMVIRPKPISCSKGKSSKGLDSEISIEDTIIRAHKHMFSIDKEYLYIPNAQGPDFGLQKALTSKTDIQEGGFLQMENGQIKTQNFEPNGLPTENKFPQPNSITITGANVYDSSFEPIEADAYAWGYLKDLYINFDFFIQCMDRNGYLIKDVALEILNGLSGACNLFWDFQIVNTGSTSKTKKNTGDECLIVVDKSFTGKPPSSRKSLLSLQTIGTNSPFLSFSMKMEIAGAMANQVVAQRNSEMSPGGTSDNNIESKPESFSGLFSSVPDGVTRVLNTITTLNEEEAKRESERIANLNKTQDKKDWDDYQKKVDDGTATLGDHWSAVGTTWFDDNEETNFFSQLGTAISETASSVWESSKVGLGFQSKEEKKARASNYELFLQKAGVFPKVNDPDKADFSNGFWDWNPSNNVKIGPSTMVCATWSDSQLLRQVYEYDLNPKNNPLELHKELKKNPGYLPVEANFTIHGVSGLKVGDMMHFKDLPYVYRRKLFTVFEVEQTINDDLWETSVTTKLRNMDI